MYGFGGFRLPSAGGMVLEGPEQPKEKNQEPEDNDGRENCWWCEEQTETRILFTSSYQVCPKCQK